MPGVRGRGLHLSGRNPPPRTQGEWRTKGERQSPPPSRGEVCEFVTNWATCHSILNDLNKHSVKLGVVAYTDTVLSVSNFLLITTAIV